MNHVELGELSGNIATTVMPQDFDLQRAPEALAGLTGQILYDLFDQTAKWGQHTNPLERTVSLYDPETRWGLFVSTNISTKTILVVKTYEDKPRPPQIIEKVLPVLTRSGIVVWDSRLTAEEAAETIIKWDKHAASAGYVNAETGERYYKGRFSNS